MKLGRITWGNKTRTIILDSIYVEHSGVKQSSTAPSIAAEPTGGELLDCSIEDLFSEFDAAGGDAMKRIEVANRHRTGQRVAVAYKDLMQPHRPGKVICVGLNFAAHIAEMGHPQPDVPTLFAKFPDALTAPFADLKVPSGAGTQLDYEGEYGVVLGRTAFQVSEEEANDYIAAETIVNDFSQRDRQYATEEWLQGKTLQACSPFGPWLSIVEPGAPLAGGTENRYLRTWVNGELRQEAPLSDLVFSPAKLVSYISQFVQLNPGDLIATGTPAGVGHGRGEYLTDGDVVRIHIDKLGAIENKLVVTDQ